MTVNSLNDYSTTPASNTNIAGTNIEVGCAPQDVGVFMRTVMAQIAYAVQGSGGTIPATWNVGTLIAANGTISSNMTVDGNLVVDGTLTLSGTVSGLTALSASGLINGGTVQASGALIGATGSVAGLLSVGTVSAGTVAATVGAIGGLLSAGTIAAGSGSISGNLAGGTLNTGGTLGVGGAANIIGYLTAGGISTVTAPVVSYGYQTNQGQGANFGSHIFNIWFDGSVAYLYVDSSNLGSFAYTSDQRIKRNIRNARPTGDIIASLRVVTYQHRRYGPMKASETRRLGFIADEVADVLPSAVHVPAGDPNALKSLDPIPLIAALVREVQDLRSRVAALELMR